MYINEKICIIHIWKHETVFVSYSIAPIVTKSLQKSLLQVHHNVWKRTQIDLEEFTESDIEQKVQILTETNQNMDSDPAETEKENPVTTKSAMTIACYLRSYHQSDWV